MLTHRLHKKTAEQAPVHERETVEAILLLYGQLSDESQRRVRRELVLGTVVEPQTASKRRRDKPTP